jgi:hypothetical protein
VHPRLSLEPRAEHNGCTRFSPTPRAGAARRVQGFEVVAPPRAGADGAHDRRARGGVNWPHPGGCRPRARRGNGRRTKNGDPKVLPLLSTLQLEHFRLYSGAKLRNVASQVRRLWITLCLVEPRQESSLVFTRLRLRKYYYLVGGLRDNGAVRSTRFVRNADAASHVGSGRRNRRPARAGRRLAEGGRGT